MTLRTAIEIFIVQFSVDLNFITFKAPAISASLTSLSSIQWHFFFSIPYGWRGAYRKDMKHVRARLKINPCEIVNHLRAFSWKFMAVFFRSAQTARRHGMSALWFSPTPVFNASRAFDIPLWTFNIRRWAQKKVRKNFLSSHSIVVTRRVKIDAVSKNPFQRNHPARRHPFSREQFSYAISYFVFVFSRWQWFPSWKQGFHNERISNDFQSF